MKQAELEKMFIEHKAKELAFEGACHDCKEEVQVLATWTDDGISISGGAVYKPFAEEKFYIKCESCYKKDNVLRDYQPCDIYSRSVGYLRPVTYWNEGKQSEFAMRKSYDINKVEKLKI